MFWRKIFCSLIFFLIIPSLNARGSQHGDTDATPTEFNPGEMIIDHIKDGHDWHIMTIRDRHISIPLPILLIHDGKFHAFMSSKFHHGHADYRGFRLMSEGEHAGKIVHVDAQGHISPKLPIDLSITKNVFSLIFVAILLAVIFVNVSKTYRRRGTDQAPTGFQNLIEPVIVFIRDDVAKISIPEKHIDRYLPYLLTLFFFILFSNLLGLIPFFPGGANVTGNIAVTFALAVFTFLITNFSGKRAYFQEIFNHPAAPWWVKFPIPLLPAIEVMGIFIKPFVLMIRLFANIMAGHIIMLGLICLIFIFGQMDALLGYGASVISIAFALFISVLEILVSFIQAFIFTLLTSLYIGAAVEEEHH